MPFGEFWWENDEGHQPVERVPVILIVVIVRFGLENCNEKIAQLGGLDRDGPSKEVLETLGKISNLNVSSNAIILVDLAHRVEQL